MAWHLPYRPTQLHYAVSAALLCALGAATALPVAKAATIGKTIITSAQHEPLVAVISVSDIDSNDFSASLANSVVYQQMGLTPTASLSVNFVPTSASTGQLMISSSQPVSKPFADVVLAINDKGQRDLVPRTLLMPLGANVAIESPNRVLASATKPNLPVISAAPAPTVTATIAKPLTLKRGAPPPLVEQNKGTTTIQVQDLAPINKPNLSINKALPVISVATAPNLPLAPAQSITSSSQITATPHISRNDSDLMTNNVASIANSIDSMPLAPTNDAATDELLAQTASPVASSATNVQQNLLTQSKTENSILEDSSASTNKALNNKAANATALNNTLNIEVTRQITVRNSPINKVNSTDSPTLALKFDESIASLNATKDAPLNTQAANTLAADKLADEQAEDLQSALDANATTNVDATNTKTTNTETDSNVVQTDKAPMVNYTVQRNDNLWVISKQIAEQNNLDIATVMSQIQAQNPNAFINQDADQLKADAQLSLPNYEVVPSQSSLQAAIVAQRERFLRTQKVQDKISDKAKAKSADALDSSVNKAAAVSAVAKNAEKKPKSKPSKTSAKTTIQTLPQARFSVVAPGSKGEADGTQTKSTSATGNGLDTNVLASLKSSRKSTAAQAQRVISTSSTLGSYTQKLQLQNQKLAELEARLKKLRNQ